MRSLLVLGLLTVSCCVLRAEETSWSKLTHITSDKYGGGDATISPDGTRFLATSRRAGNWDVWMYDIPSRQWTQLTDDPAQDFEGRFSPDGTAVVFCSARTGQKDIWVLQLATNKLTRLTSSQYDDEYPVWSPDGKRIFYTGGPWQRRHIYEIDLAGGQPRQLTKVPSFLGACSMAADGETLFCHRYDSGDGDLFRLSRTTGRTVALTEGRAWDYKPVPSPDTSCIAFSRSIEGPSHIWLLSTDGRRSRQVTRSPYSDRWPTWSSSGRQLLFHRIVEQGRGLKVFDLKSSQVTTLVTADQSPLYGSLDPSGGRLVYSCQNAGQRRLRILDLSSGEIEMLNTGVGDVDFPKWSPDGKSIAFVKRGPTRWDLWVMDAGGGNQRILTESNPDLRGMDGPLSWSPDSSRLAFQSDTEAFSANLFSVEIASGKIEPLTDGPFFDEAPCWTPDGRGVVFMSTRGGNWTWCLYRLELETSKLTQLTDPNWVEKNYPQASPEAGLICSMVNDQGEQMLAAADRGGTLSLLPSAGTGVRWPSYSSDFTRVLFSDVSHHVEYWLATDLLNAELEENREFSISSSAAGAGDSPPPLNSVAGMVGDLSPLKLDER